MLGRHATLVRQAQVDHGCMPQCNYMYKPLAKLRLLDPSAETRLLFENHFAVLISIALRARSVLSCV